MVIKGTIDQTTYVSRLPLRMGSIEVNRKTIRRAAKASHGTRGTAVGRRKSGKAELGYSLDILQT
jgi:hypothetical protein